MLYDESLWDILPGVEVLLELDREDNDNLAQDNISSRKIISYYLLPFVME